MPAFPVKNTQGQTVSTIQVGQVDSTTAPLKLVGDGVSPYGEIIAENFYQLLENFANPTPPTNPVEGQLWFCSTAFSRFMSVFVAGNWVALGTQGNTSILMGRLAGATNLDFTSVHSVPIAQPVISQHLYHPTAVLLRPNGAIAATTNPSFDISIASSGDVLTTTTVTNFGANKHHYFPISGAVRYGQLGDTISLNVTTAATGGRLSFDVYIFAFLSFTT